MSHADAHDARSSAIPETGPETGMVLLEHTTPDGASHFDWMIERPNDRGEHRLITFRCAADPLESRDPNVPWSGQRLPDHRARYLSFEGDIGGGRGVVRRVWTRRCRVVGEGAERIDLAVAGVPGRFMLRRMAGGVWSLGADGLAACGSPPPPTGPTGTAD